MNTIILFKFLRHLFLLAVLRIRALVVGRLDILFFSFPLLLKFKRLKYSCVQAQLRKVRLSSDNPVHSPIVCLLVHLGMCYGISSVLKWSNSTGYTVFHFCNGSSQYGGLQLTYWDVSASTSFRHPTFSKLGFRHST